MSCTPAVPVSTRVSVGMKPPLGRDSSVNIGAASKKAGKLYKDYDVGGKVGLAAGAPLEHSPIRPQC